MAITNDQAIAAIGAYDTASSILMTTLGTNPSDAADAYENALTAVLNEVGISDGEGQVSRNPYVQNIRGSLQSFADAKGSRAKDGIIQRIVGEQLPGVRSSLLEARLVELEGARTTRRNQSGDDKTLDVAYNL